MRAQRILNIRVVALLWAVLPFAALSWARSSAVWSGDRQDTVTVLILFCVVAAVIVAAAFGLWLGRLWAQALVGVMSGALTLYSAGVLLWMAASSSAILIVAVAGVTIGLYSILSLAIISMKR